MKLIKLLLASLLLAGALQANEYKQNHNNATAYAVGLASGIIIFNALASRHEARPTYVVYQEPKHHKSYPKPYYSHKKHVQHKHYYACEHDRGRDSYFRDDRRR